MKLEEFIGGCDKEPVDHRDRAYMPTSSSVESIKEIDLRPLCYPIRDQGWLSSCTAFATTSLVRHVRKKLGLKDWEPSPLFTYYASRKIQGNTDKNEGVYNRFALKSTIDYGVSMEFMWPYKNAAGQYWIEPPQNVWKSAERHQTLEYQRINDANRNEFLTCLNEGYPFIFGLRIYSSFFETPETGIVPIPDKDTEKSVGGHAMLAVGYKIIDDKEYIIIQNSWGTIWGEEGYGYIPMEYFDSNASYDFWTIRNMEKSEEEDAKEISEEEEKQKDIEDAKEAKKIEDAKKLEEAKKIEEEKKAEEARKLEEQKKLEEAKKIEEEKQKRLLNPTVGDTPLVEEKISFWKNPITYCILAAIIIFSIFFFFM